MSNPSNYKRYQLCQLGIKESAIKPSDVNRGTFPGIDPDELEKDAEEEHDEHGMPVNIAIKTAEDYLGASDQKHYDTGMEKAKKQGMLKDMISPTAMRTPVIGMAVRGSSTGGFPSGIDQTGIASDTPTGRLGGYEPISPGKDNSKVVNKTPHNITIDSSTPISKDGGTTQNNTHPHQVQQMSGEPPQDITGASTDSDATLTIKQVSSEPPVEKEKSVDIDVNQEEKKEPNDMDGQESMEDEDQAKAGLNEGKHKNGCQCGFCKNLGSFGKKKKKEDEGVEPEKAFDDDKKKDKKLIVDRDKNDKADKVEEKYSPPFERMRGLANLGSRRLSKNGIWEGIRVPGPTFSDRVSGHNPDIDKNDKQTWTCLDCGKSLSSNVSSYCQSCLKNRRTHGEKTNENVGSSEKDVIAVGAPGSDARNAIEKGATCKSCGKSFTPSYEGHYHCPSCLGSQHANAEKPTGVQETVGASEPFTTKWKMDKEKAGMVKVNECKSCGPNCTCEKLGECKSCGCGKSNTKHALNELGGPATNMGFVRSALRQFNGDKQKAIVFLNKMADRPYQNKAIQLSEDYSRAASFLEQNPNYNVDETKITTEKLNEVHQSLIKKAQAGKMNAKETQVYQLLKEVLQKRKK